MRELWELEVAGSNPASPTEVDRKSCGATFSAAWLGCTGAPAGEASNSRASSPAIPPMRTCLSTPEACSTGPVRRVWTRRREWLECAGRRLRPLGRAGPRWCGRLVRLRAWSHPTVGLSVVVSDWLATSKCHGGPPPSPPPSPAARQSRYGVDPPATAGTPCLDLAGCREGAPGRRAPGPRRSHRLSGP